MKAPNADLTTEHTACIPRHTPGPWNITEEPDHDGTFYAIRNRRGYLIATTATHDLTKEREANARLIASAPQLLEALEAIKAVSHEFDVMPEAAMKMYEIARAAINAAKGVTL